jgi:hypothetical protein
MNVVYATIGVRATGVEPVWDDVGRSVVPSEYRSPTASKAVASTNSTTPAKIAKWGSRARAAREDFPRYIPSLPGFFTGYRTSP